MRLLKKKFAQSVIFQQFLIIRFHQQEVVCILTLPVLRLYNYLSEDLFWFILLIDFLRFNV